MARSCRIGLHGRNDVEFYEADYQVVREAKIEVLKMMSHTRLEHFKELQTQNPGLQFITRLYDGPNFGTHGHPHPEDFARRMIPVMNRLRPYCIRFEIHNEPNHSDRIEGWGDRDEDARDFNTWFLRVYEILKGQCPWAQLGFPGLAIPHRDLEWLEICRPAVEQADWLGVHCYWQTPAGQERNHLLDFWGLRFKYYHKRFPHKVIELTEVGNSNVQNQIPLSEEKQAREFTEYLTECFKYPYLGSACFFILSSPDPTWEGFVWRSENGRLHQVVRTIGQMPRPVLVPPRVRELVVAGDGASLPVVPLPTPGPGSSLNPPPAPPAAGEGAPWTGLQLQLQQLQLENTRLRSQLQQLQTENAQLRAQLQQLSAPVPEIQPGVGPLPVTPPAGAIPAPPIENLVGRLKRHPSLQYPGRSLSQIDRIIIHHTAIDPNVGAERIAEHLVDKKNRPGIGYHFFITAGGQIQQTNELTTVSRHATEALNPVSIGIGFAGDFTQVPPSPAQIEAGAQLIAWLLRRLNLPLEAVYGYKELVATQSPGNQWDSGARWGDQLRQRIQAYLSGVT